MKMQRISDEDLKILRKRSRRDKSGLLAHLLDCYLTVFENACDASKDTLEFKPDIIAAREDYELQQIMQSEFNR